MKLIKETVYEMNAPNTIPDVDNELSRFYKGEIDEFSILFEMNDIDGYILFAYVYGIIMSSEHLDRVVQIETATLDKRTMEVFYHRDNNGKDNYSEFNNLPAWTHDDLRNVGVTEFRDCDVRYEQRDLTWDC